MNAQNKNKHTTNNKHTSKGEQSQEAAPKTSPAASFESIVRKNFDEGILECNLRKHHVRISSPILKADGTQAVSVKGNPSYRVDAAPILSQEGGWKKVLNMMMPGDLASCPCERKACETAWRPHHQDYVRYGSRYVDKGTYKVGIEGVGNRQLFVTDLLLSKDVKAKLAEAHPSFYFVGGDTPHSHPFMHITTQIATRTLLDRLVHISAHKPYSITDLHGNPRSNVQTMKTHSNLTIQTIVEFSTAEDCVRLRNKWAGAPYVQSSLRSCGTSYEPKLKMEDMDAIMSVHSGYYYDFLEVRNALLKIKESGSFWMVMHKFPLAKGVVKGSEHDRGTFGHGEVTWIRRKTMSSTRSGQPIYLIEQTDTMTGKKYIHNDNSYWFENTTWSDGDKERATDGMAWDISACGPDTYLFQVVRCPFSLAWTQATFAQALDLCPPVYADNNEKKLLTGEVLPGVVVGAPKSFLEAKDALCGVLERDQKRWGEHVARYRRLLVKHKESEEDLFETALLCYFADVKSNREQLIIAFASARASELKAKRAVATKADPRDWGAAVGRTLLLGAALASVAHSPPNKIVSEVLGHAAHTLQEYV